MLNPERVRAVIRYALSEKNRFGDGKRLAAELGLSYPSFKVMVHHVRRGTFPANWRQHYDEVAHERSADSGS